MEPSVVRADPTKDFFIYTITKDISLEDCILDLIDNSLDGASRLLGHPMPQLEDGVDLSPFHVELSIGKDSFNIHDNCGGISLDDAVNYAFTFGRVEDDAPEDFSIGLYGIGMKRAIFKMGRKITIRSTYSGDGTNPAISFEVPIDVAEWRRRKDWDFDLTDAEKMPDHGVNVNVSDLHEAISNEFSNPRFINNLRSIIARDYSHFISNGFTISVNGRAVPAYQFNFLVGDGFNPYRAKFKLRGVEVEIVAGAGARPSDDPDPEDGSAGEDRSGWYVLCNGRIVLAADKTTLTGWGADGAVRWHPQFRGFVGLILFSARSANELPLTTTKRSIDRESIVYRLALVRMMELTRSWVDYTNHRKLSLQDAKISEARATSIALVDLPASATLTFPNFRTPAEPKVRLTTIQYPKSPEEIAKLAVALGNPNLSAREVGVRSFDFAFKELGAGDN